MLSAPPVQRQDDSFSEEILGVERPSPAVQCAAADGAALFMDVTVEPRLTAVGDAYYLGYSEHRSLRSETLRRSPPS